MIFKATHKEKLELHLHLEKNLNLFFNQLKIPVLNSSQQKLIDEIRDCEEHLFLWKYYIEDIDKPELVIVYLYENGFFKASPRFYQLAFEHYSFVGEYILALEWLQLCKNK